MQDYSELVEMQSKCSQILLDGNLTIDEDSGVLSFDLEEKDKDLFVEYAVNMILLSAINNLSETIESK